ncbi:MAG: DUF192 domain-containing protein [Candidatus Krumholzibacteriota bacterium]|nr:DUF192 domain-containing protein [Candidatus Krumholzibacteriota bacterium]
MSVRNRSKDRLIAETILTLNSQFRKTLYMLNRHGIPDNCVLWISPCNGIYTAGMKTPIDIAFLDSKGRVTRILKEFPPDSFAGSGPKAISAIELPNGRLAETDTGVGDLVEILLD